MPTLDSNIMELVAGSLIMVLGATLQASVGYGLALAVVPLLALINPDFIPGPMLFASLFLALIMSFRGWSAIDRGQLIHAFIGLLLGTGAGVAGLMFIAPQNLPKLFGVFILIAVALSLSGIRVPLSKGSLVAAGTISGVMGTMVGIHGPPMALLYQRQPGATVRGTLALFFVAGYAVALGALFSIRLFSARELVLGLGLAPGVLVGYVFSRFVAGYLDRGFWLRGAILTIATLSALALLFKS